jgi:hypothetical protein
MPDVTHTKANEAAYKAASLLWPVLVFFCHSAAQRRNLLLRFRLLSYIYSTVTVT